VRIRIAKGWPPLVLAAFLIASGCGAGRFSLPNAGCNANQESPSDDGCREFGGPNSRCSWLR
jgi:hypothetical protein